MKKNLYVYDASVKQSERFKNCYVVKIAFAGGSIYGYKSYPEVLAILRENDFELRFPVIERNTLIFYLMKPDYELAFVQGVLVEIKLLHGRSNV